jgi:methylenetetrahydrofolate dehydrogenase (NADP+)/methenyltetrahydrofolate cyclohydrolase
MTTILDGKAFATAYKKQVAADVAELKEKHGISLGLAVLLVGEDPASDVYVRNKGKAAEECGIHSITERLPANTSQEYLLKRVHDLNHDPRIHGILVQLPLPPQIDANAIINAIDPSKDVDGFHVVNAGKLATKQDSLVPCTPLGCLLMLEAYYGGIWEKALSGETGVLRDLVRNRNSTALEGLHAVIIGCSNIVGKPMAQLLLNAGCTVTMCHSKTRNTAEIARTADIIVVAVGKPALVQADWVKKGATVIDVGINRVTLPDGKSVLIGDVDFPAASKVAGAITPVPGGVGPMTIACLLSNTAKAARSLFA